MVEAPGDRGRALPLRRRRRDVALVNSSQPACARGRSTSTTSTSTRRTQNEVWVNELSLHKSTDGGKTFDDVADAARRQPRHLVQPRQPDIMPSRSTTAAPTSRAMAGARWSIDPESADRRDLHGRGRRAVSVSPLQAAAGQLDAHRAERPAGVVGLRSSRAGVDAGVGLRDRRDLADARRQGHLGRLQGRSRALQRRRPARRRAHWVYPQNRYGHDPDDIKFRFPRQTVIYRLAARPETSSIRLRTCCTGRPTTASRGR